MTAVPSVVSISVAPSVPVFGSFHEQWLVMELLIYLVSFRLPDFVLFLFTSLVSIQNPVMARRCMDAIHAVLSYD